MNREDIADELCTCGHLRSEHSPHGIHRDLDGHGGCDKCPCIRFTWKSFVDKDGNPIE